MTIDDDLSGRFLNATEEIKESLGRTYGETFSGVGEAYNYAIKKKNRTVLRNKAALRELIQLRNVMQHSHVLDGKVLATPRLDAVEAIEEISRNVQSAPRISKYMVKEPEVLAPTDSIAKAAELIIGKGYSQLPVYGQGKYHSLFTTNALARWLSEAVRRENGHLIEENLSVSVIVDFAEDFEKPKFVKGTESAGRVCSYLSQENSLPAVLVTTDGTENGQLQGIVTRFDVPNILREITTKFP